MKALEIESEAHAKPLLMAQGLFEAIHNIITTAILTLDSGAF
ncbi:hypothetical protein [Helicobacter pylori]|nr:hypothetical protein [Helicobacter pylori]